MYPFKFQSIYIEKIWGGQELKTFKSNLPNTNIGESWDISCYGDKISIISNGKFKGQNLKTLIDTYNEKILGVYVYNKFKEFPLLLKFISARENLSIQVHPKKDINSYEKRKKEAWYVLEAKKGSYFILGSNTKDKDLIKDSINKGILEKYLNKVFVKTGDVFYIESGLIHAIGAGITLIEIQESSDTTYRLYDYNRGRKLDVEKALLNANLALNYKKHLNLVYRGEKHLKKFCCACSKFTIEKYEIYEYLDEVSDKDRFFIFTCINGSGKILYKNGQEFIQMGDSILIPATLGNYKILGQLELLRFTIPMN